MRDLVFICAHPDDNYFVWQTEVLINNFRKYNISDKMHILLYKPKQRNWNPEFDVLIERYPEVKFFKYEDKGAMVGVYLPVLRPHILKQHFKAHPELSEKAIFYHDCDIIFTEQPKLDHLLDDDNWYVSNTKDYIPYSYFASKIKDVKHAKLGLWNVDQVLEPLLVNMGTTVEAFQELGDDAGGAQYLLKNIDWKFWDKCEQACVNIYLYFKTINLTYFDTEDKGIQRWCADMWAILWNGLALHRTIKVVPEMDFCWATENISDRKVIFHNAGVISGKEDMFFKGDYISIAPWKEDFSYINTAKCSSLYVDAILETKAKYHTMTPVIQEIILS